MAGFYDALREIFRHNESSSYGGVNPNDNGALSLGLLQWHAARALGLMRMIGEEPGGADIIKAELGEGMYNDIMTGSNNLWNSYVIPSGLVSAFRAVLESTPGHNAQDELFQADCANYVSVAKSYNINTSGAQLYFCDLYNQSPKQALNIARACGGDMSLDNLHKQALANNIMGKYASRRNWTYDYCRTYSGEGSGITPPVKPPPIDPGDDGEGTVGNVTEYIQILNDGQYLIHYSDNFPNGRLYMKTVTDLYVPRKAYTRDPVTGEEIV